MDIFREVWNEYCNELSWEPKLGSRMRPEVEMRAAFANASAPFFHASVCARLFNKDRTTVSHYIGNHEYYYINSPDYRSAFDVASRIITDKIYNMPKENLTLEAQNFLRPHEQVDTIEGLIETLKTFKEKIQYRLRYGKSKSLQERRAAGMAYDAKNLGKGSLHGFLRDEQLQVQDESGLETNVKHRRGPKESAVV